MPAPSDNCGNCLYARPRQTDSRPNVRSCVRYPPQASDGNCSDSVKRDPSRWALVFVDEWCGEYKKG